MLKLIVAIFVLNLIIIIDIFALKLHPWKLRCLKRQKIKNMRSSGVSKDSCKLPSMDDKK